jgi:hypothetical protein
MSRVVMGAAILLVTVLVASCQYSPPMTAAEAEEQREIYRQAASVRVTLNPESVRGCKSLGVVIFYRGSPEDQLRYGTADRGGNVALAAPGSVNPGQPAGEPYLCEQPKP